MMNLVSANFSRLKRDRVFWIVLAVMPAAGIVYLLARYADYPTINVENEIFYLLQFLCIPLSAFCSLFTGIEYADGTIRNKVIAGHSRPVIYLAQWLTNTAACAAVCVVYLAAFCAVGIPLTGLSISISSLLVSFAGILLAIAGYASVCTLIGMLCRSRAVGTVVCLLAAGGIMIGSSSISQSLIRPHFYTHTEFNDAGEIVRTYLEENPRYTDGTVRQVYGLLMDILPGGQLEQTSILLSHLQSETDFSAPTIEWPDVSPLPRVMGGACAFIAATTCAGVLVFRKKNLQ